VSEILGIKKIVYKKTRNKSVKLKYKKQKKILRKEMVCYTVTWKLCLCTLNSHVIKGIVHSS